MQQVALIAALVAQASAHAVISAVIGTSGPQGIGLGVSASYAIRSLTEELQLTQETERSATA